MNSNKEYFNNQIDEGRIYAILSYIPFLCFIPLFKSNINNFAKKHVKQGLLLLFIEIISLLFLIESFSRAFWTLVLLVCFAIAVIGILKSIAGKEMKIPVIGNFFEKYDI